MAPISGDLFEVDYHCDPLEPPEPQEVKSDSKSDFRGFPNSDFFDPESGLWGVKKVTFGVAFRSLWGKPRKSLFESLLISWGSGGSRGFPGSQDHHRIFNITDPRSR